MNYFVKNELKVRVVLVQPRNPLNIGAAARAMSNFGFNDLAVVNPYGPVWRETISAVGAEPVVLGANAVSSLDKAIEGCALVLGTTTVRDRRLLRPVVPLNELEAYFELCGVGPSSRIALVFGPEKTGLNNKHLEMCNAYLNIPTFPDTPSMNLSHAVAVCCYELARSANVGLKNSPELATAESRERLVQHVLELFNAAGYLRKESPAKKLNKVRQTLIQWNLRSSDLWLMHGIIRYLLRKMIKKD